jgi:DNA-binding XRE family transcriptional regulator
MSDLIHIDGKAFVLVPVHEYRRLTGHAQNEPETLPDSVLDLIAAGSQHPVKILRKFRNLTQAQLAAAAGLSRPYLTEIETGKKSGSISAMKSLAEALQVSTSILIG